jgi:hypothetical protein
MMLVDALAIGVLATLLIVTAVRERRTLVRIRAAETREEELDGRETALSEEISRRQAAIRKDREALEQAKARVQDLQAKYTDARDRLIAVRRVPVMEIWSPERHHQPSSPLWCLEVDCKGPVRVGLALPPSDEVLASGMHERYLIAAPSAEEAERQLRGRVTSFEFDVTRAEPATEAVRRLTEPRRAAAAPGAKTA